MGGEDETRKQVEEDATEDLELKAEEADEVGGGAAPMEQVSIQHEGATRKL